MKKSLLLVPALLTALTVPAQMRISQTGLTSFQKGITVETPQNQMLDLKFTGTSGGSKPIIYISSSTLSKRALIAYYQGMLTYSFEGDGRLYARGGVLQSSDSSRKNNISGLNSSLDKITALRGVRFDYTSPEPQAARSATRSFSSATSGQNPVGETEEINPEDGIDSQIQQQMEQEKSRQRIGLIAQEVEQVLPEAVRTLPDGSKGIYYSDLTGVLIEAVKELHDSLSDQNRKITELEQRLETLETLLNLESPAHSPLRSVSGLSETEGNPVQPGLSQNRPNPFTQQTSIDYRLPAEATDCRICVYNLNGRQLKQYPLSSEEKSGTLTISASQFEPGIYLYSLIADGQEIDSKRMILTE